MAIGVGSKEAQAVRSALSRDLKCVVLGNLVSLKQVNLRKIRIGTIHGYVRSSWRTSIYVAQVVQMDSPCSYIGKLEDGRIGNFLLDGCMPLFAVRCLGMRV